MSDEAPPRIVVCAWCPGFKPGHPPELTSHGICATCFARVTDSEPPPDDVDVELPIGPTTDFHD